jgi:Matrixin
VSRLEKTIVGAALVGVLVTLVGLAIPGEQFRGADARPLTYFVADGDTKSGYHGSDRELAIWALETWARTSGGALQLQPSPESDAVVRLYWPPAGEGQFGEMRPLTVKGQTGAAVFVRTDVDALGLEISLRARRDPLWRDAIVYLTCLHELGHALGLSHSADKRDAMYYFGYGGDIVDYFARYRQRLKSRTDIQITSGLSAVDTERLRALHRQP